MNNHQSASREVDHMFDEFVTQPDDELNHGSAVAEALEDRGRENEDDDVDKVLEDFVQEPYRK